MPGLVPGIQPTADAGARVALDPGNKCRDDTVPSVEVIGAMTTTFPATGKVRLRTNLADNPVVRALKDGEVNSDLVDFDFCGPKPANQGFKPMIREGAFDAGELAIGSFLQAKVYGKPLVLLPAVVMARFQHHTILYNAAKGELEPKDLEGRRIAVRSYTQTTGIWVRGILKPTSTASISTASPGSAPTTPTSPNTAIRQTSSALAPDLAPAPSRSTRC